MELNVEQIIEIAKYISENYPESCIGYNLKKYKMDYSEIADEILEDCEDFFYLEKLDWCGCGDPSIAKHCIRDYLKIIKMSNDIRDPSDAYEVKEALMADRFGCKTIYDNELLLCLAYALDAAGFTDHGSSIGGAWITKEGEMFLNILTSKKDE